MPRDGTRTSSIGRYDGPPMTLGNMRANGVRTLDAWCLGRDCHHHRVLDVSAMCAYRRTRPPIPTDRDPAFRSIATSAARVLTAPLDEGGDVSLPGVGQARREAVPVVNRRDPRATRSALTAGTALRAGGPC